MNKMYNVIGVAYNFIEKVEEMVPEPIKDFYHGGNLHRKLKKAMKHTSLSSEMLPLKEHNLESKVSIKEVKRL